MVTPARHRHQDPPHLTTIELANRWRCRRETISRRWRKWGFRPIGVAGCLLFPIEQIEAIERKRMIGGEIEDTGTAAAEIKSHGGAREGAGRPKKVKPKTKPKTTTKTKPVAKLAAEIEA